MGRPDQERPKLLYDPHDYDSSPNPDYWRSYDIADVNPKWFTDVLGPWEFRRTPLEIELSAIDSERKISTAFRFTPDMTHIFSVTMDGVEPGKPDPAIEAGGMAKIKFGNNQTDGSYEFSIITNEWAGLVTLHEDGRYIGIQCIPSDKNSPICRIPFVNPKPPEK